MNGPHSCFELFLIFYSLFSIMFISPPDPCYRPNYMITHYQYVAGATIMHYMGQVLHGPVLHVAIITRDEHYIGRTLHGADITWGRYYMGKYYLGQVLHGTIEHYMGRSLHGTSITRESIT